MQAERGQVVVAPAQAGDRGAFERGTTPPSPLPPGETSIHPGNQLELSGLVLWSGPPALAGTRRVFQGFFVDPDSKALVATNRVVLDHAP